MSIANDIRNKIYGKDVREAIALGVEETESIIASYNAQVMNAGNSNAEIVDARGAYSNLGNRLNDSDTKVNALSSGSPKAVTLLSEMTDTTKNYVYVGVEVGYVSGNWYYYNGSAWVSGGIYQTTGIASDSITYNNIKKSTFEILKSNANVFNDCLNPKVNTIFSNATTGVKGEGVSIRDSLIDLDFLSYGCKSFSRFEFDTIKNFYLVGNCKDYDLYHDVDTLNLTKGSVITFGALAKLVTTDGNTTFGISIIQYDSTNSLIINDTMQLPLSQSNVTIFKKTVTLNTSTKYIQFVITNPYPITNVATIDVGAWYLIEGIRPEAIHTNVNDGIESVAIQNSIDFSKIYTIGDSLVAGFYESLNARWSWWTGQILETNITNKGIFGDSTTGVLNRLDADVIANKPSHCLLLVGTNDINNGVPYSTYTANVKTITQNLIDANITPIWITVPPRNDNVTLLPIIRKYNYFLYGLCKENNIPFIDIYNLLSNADGTGISGVRVADDLHFNAKGALMVGSEIAKLFTKRHNEIQLVYFKGDINTIIKNPQMDNLLLDGKADNWDIVGNFGSNGKYEIVPINGFNYQVLEKINNVNCYMDLTNVLSVAVGKTYRLESNVIYNNTNGVEETAGLVAYIVFIDGSGNSVGSYNYIIGSTIIDTIDNLRISNIFTVPANTVTTQLIFRITSTSNKTLKVGKVNCYEV